MMILNGWVRLGPLVVALMLVVLCYRGVNSVSAQPLPPGSGEVDPLSQFEELRNLPANRVNSVSANTAAPPVKKKKLLTILYDGGPLMIPILLCSFMMFIFVFERFICLRRGNILPRTFVKHFMLQLQEGQLGSAEAIQRCEENRSPIAKVFAAAMSKWGRSSVEIEQAVMDAGERVTNGLRRNLRVLNAVATVCPLLGLLGTVVGMIRAFKAIADVNAMGRPELLADGISQALLTTAAGLSVAIPALLFYLYFVSCVDRRTMEIDALGHQVVQLICGDQPPKKTAKSVRTKKKTT